jgi:hypothetical protein
MADAESRPARQCPKGHTMDPNWVTCPYCEAEQRASRQTSRPEVAASSGGRETKVGEVLQKAERRETKTMPQEAVPGSGGPLGAGDTRKIVGVLITYTWRPEGELFPVREGKNFIGSGKVSSDASHRNCEVQIPQDGRMSSEHALILCRHGQYEIIDQASSNGTFLGDEMLMSNQSTKLPDYAEIKTGDTLWTFIKIKAPKTAPGIITPDQTGTGEPTPPRIITKVE